MEEESKILLFQPRSSFKRRRPSEFAAGSTPNDLSSRLPPEFKEALRQLQEGAQEGAGEQPAKKPRQSHLRLVKNDEHL